MTEVLFPVELFKKSCYCEYCDVWCSNNTKFVCCEKALLNCLDEFCGCTKARFLGFDEILECFIDCVKTLAPE